MGLEEGDSGVVVGGGDQPDLSTPLAETFFLCRLDHTGLPLQRLAQGVAPLRTQLGHVVTGGYALAPVHDLAQRLELGHVLGQLFECAAVDHAFDRGQTGLPGPDQQVQERFLAEARERPSGCRSDLPPKPCRS